MHSIIHHLIALWAPILQRSNDPLMSAIVVISLPAILVISIMILVWRANRAKIKDVAAALDERRSSGLAIVPLPPADDRGHKKESYSIEDIRSVVHIVDEYRGRGWSHEDVLETLEGRISERLQEITSGPPASADWTIAFELYRLAPRKRLERKALDTATTVIVANNDREAAFRLLDAVPRTKKHSADWKRAALDLHDLITCERRDSQEPAARHA